MSISIYTQMYSPYEKKKKEEKKCSQFNLKEGGTLTVFLCFMETDGEYKETGCKTDRQTTYRTKHLKNTEVIFEAREPEV